MLECNICEFRSRKQLTMEKHLLRHNDGNSEYIEKLNFDNIKYVYVHIPKCAGTTIRKRLKCLQDCVIVGTPNNLDNFQNRVINLKHTSFTNCNFGNKLICFVRNPYSRVISMYNYHKLNRLHGSINDFIKKNIWY